MRLLSLLLPSLGLLVLLAACGGNPPASLTDEPISARFAVIDVKVSAEGARVESIVLLSGDGKELRMVLAEDIDPAIWGPRNLQGHVESGKALGFKVGVTYVQTPNGQTVIELTE